MWAYYADGHQGVAIHLNPRFWPIAAAMRVSYSDRYPTVPLSIGPDDPELVRRFALRKGNAWRHEGEYRILTHDHDARRFDLKWVSTNTAVFSRGAITGITVGCRMSDAAIQQVIAAARAARPPVPTFRAVADRKRFKLTFKAIP
jgi:hypothetical protein